MIRATPSGFKITADGFPVYLDNWAIGDLAEGDPSRRRRFIDTVCTGGDLLFSVANIVELAELRGPSFCAVKTFMDELGPHWSPITIDLPRVMHRERKGVGSPETYISTDLLDAYVRNRKTDFSPVAGKIIPPYEAFVSLGALVGWIAHSESPFPKQAHEFDVVLKTIKRRIGPKQNRSWLNRVYPAVTFDQSRPATFAHRSLMRTVIMESGQLKDGDAMDFFHAVLGSAFARFATLDKNWKRRVEALPKPNGLARIYDPSQLDQMVTDIELALKQRAVTP